MQSESPSKHLV